MRQGESTCGLRGDIDGIPFAEIPKARCELATINSNYEKVEYVSMG
jgi:hypothetical protein